MSARTATILETHIGYGFQRHTEALPACKRQTQKDVGINTPAHVE